jgi:hypothetical protein
MEQAAEPLVVRRSVEIAAAPETVWELLVDPVKALRWWGIGAELDRGLPNEELARNHGEGWDNYLPRLAVAAAGGDPGRDPWLDFAPRPQEKGEK